MKRRRFRLSLCHSRQWSCRSMGSWSGRPEARAGGGGGGARDCNCRELIPWGAGVASYNA